jgi:hypothetical protein
MVRSFVCAGLALIVFASFSHAEAKPGKGKKKKGTAVHGKIVSVNTAGGTVKVSVKKKGGESQDKEFKIDETTPVFSFNKDGEKTELTGKGVLKKEQFKTGAAITIKVDDAGKVTEVTFGKKAKKKKSN